MKAATRRRPPRSNSNEDRLQYARFRRGEGATIARIAWELRLTERRLYQILAEAAALDRLAS